MSILLMNALQAETEHWLHENRLTRFFNGVASEVVNGKLYLLSGNTLAELQMYGWIE